MKTLEEIKNEVAIEYSYESYDDFKTLTRKIDTDIIFVMDEFFNKVAKRYAELQCEPQRKPTHFSRWMNLVNNFV